MFLDIHSHNTSPKKFAITSIHFPEASNGTHSLGIHPWYAEETVDWEAFEQHLSDPNCVAIGECGLDKLKGPDLHVQTEVFLRQVQSAEAHQLPLIIHCVKAFNELVAIRRKVDPKCPWIIHGFSKFSLANDLIKEGFYLSLGSAICRIPISKDGSMTLKSLPLERIFLETDDQDSFKISNIYTAFAGHLGISCGQIEEQLEVNVKNVFVKWKIG